MSSNCQHCEKTFQTASSRNRHLRKVHNDNSTSSRRLSRIICPLCNTSFGSFNLLKIHLLDHHDVKCISTNITFNSKEEFNIWKEQTEKETKSFYALASTATSTSGTTLYFECHRSNMAGFQSKCKERAPKFSGSIKMNGVCPSRIKADIYNDSGKVFATFDATHVGHKDELKCLPLSEAEKESIIEQLKLGVSYDTILRIARKIENKDCSRLNLLTMKDIYNIAEKNKLTGKRSQNDFVAVDMKVNEWNKEGEKNVFLYKKIGQSHEILHKDDFALAYMNGTMEYMLKTYGQRIICADGTHGTNSYNFEFTTILVLDDQGLGYPVVFLITNRRDTLVMEVLLIELKRVIGTIVPNYLMTDDSLIYYNAWNKVMGQIPQRLLCTWHIKKNWFIHTKSKVNNLKTRKKIGRKLNILLKETDESEFFRLKDSLIKYLEENQEILFLNYLNAHYFQNKDRIVSWAHCYRKHVGININMHLESFYKTLMCEYFNGRTVQRLETCLDALDKLISDRPWKRVASILRPTATHQDLNVNKAHKEATRINLYDHTDKVPPSTADDSDTGDKLYLDIPSEAVPAEFNCESRKQECRNVLEAILLNCTSDNDYSFILKNLFEVQEALSKNNLPQSTSRKRKIEKQTLFASKSNKH